MEARRLNVAGLKLIFIVLTLIFELLCGVYLALAVFGFPLLEPAVLLLALTLVAIVCLAAANLAGR